MADVVINAPPFVVNISPLGFHFYAAEFLKSANCVSQISDGYSPVPYYLLSRSIELTLKAFLLAKGFPKQKLRKIGKNGHDLERTLKKAVLYGLHDIVVLSPSQIAELKKANTYYETKGFEYFYVINAARGYKNLPDLTVLSEIASLLVSKLESVCLNA